MNFNVFCKLLMFWKLQDSMEVISELGIIGFVELFFIAAHFFQILLKRRMTLKYGRHFSLADFDRHEP